MKTLSKYLLAFAVAGLLALAVAVIATPAHAAAGVSICDASPQPLCAPFAFQNIVLAAPTTTVVKSGAGWFHSICVNKPVASSVITIYDNTAASGTKIATITLPATLLTEGPYCADFDAAFINGLTVVTATGASDLTVMYR